MSATNRAGSSRSPNDFHETPAWSVRAILPQLPKRCRYLDAGCGSGAIGSVVAKEGTPFGLVSGVEVDVELANRAASIGMVVETADFLQIPNKEWEDTQVVISNPPYTLAMEFIQKALELVRPNMGTVAMILRIPFLAARSRAEFHQTNPSDVFILPKRPSFTGGGTDATDYAWFVWGPGRGNHWHILDIPKDATDPREAIREEQKMREEEEQEINEGGEHSEDAGGDDDSSDSGDEG